MIPESLRIAAAVIRAGGVVAYPTESCFGLGCDPRNDDAVRRILRMKRRPASKGLILIADRLRRVLPCISEIPAQSREQILRSWPGPNTWLLPASGRVGYRVRGNHDSVAIRITAHRTAAMLCRLAAIPLVSTSANRRGNRMLRSHDQVVSQFAAEVDYVVDERIGGAFAPSTIRDGFSGEILRG